MILPFIFFLLTCAVLQVAQGRENVTTKNVGIIGGHTISIEEAPYMAGFIRGRVVVCAGTIIHRQFILTSASCAKNWYPIRHAHVGSNRARKGGSYLAVSDMLCHEEYNKHTFEHNICLLKLREPIDIFASRKVGTVKLPERNIDIGAGNVVAVTGWGNTVNVGTRYPKYLQQAKIVLLPEQLCKAFSRNMTAEMMCAGAQGRDSCIGDGGGPLTQNKVQYGIVGFGPSGCGSQPTVYTKVSKYITWIHNTISNNS